jgi:hypothetical protein
MRGFLPLNSYRFFTAMQTLRSGRFEWLAPVLPIPASCCSSCCCSCIQFDSTVRQFMWCVCVQLVAGLDTQCVRLCLCCCCSILRLSYPPMVQSGATTLVSSPRPPHTWLHHPTLPGARVVACPHKPIFQQHDDSTVRVYRLFVKRSDSPVLTAAPASLTPAVINCDCYNKRNILELALQHLTAWSEALERSLLAAC